MPAVTTLAWFLLPSVYLHNMPSMPSKHRRSHCEAQPFPLNSKCCVLSKSVLTEQDQIHLLMLPLQPAPAVFLFLQQAKVPTIILYFSYYPYPVGQQISSALTPRRIQTPITSQYYFLVPFSPSYHDCFAGSLPRSSKASPASCTGTAILNLAAVGLFRNQTMSYLWLKTDLFYHSP